MTMSRPSQSQTRLEKGARLLTRRARVSFNPALRRPPPVSNDDGVNLADTICISFTVSTQYDVELYLYYGNSCSRNCLQEGRKV